MAARIRLVGGHVADAGVDRRLDLARTQAPEVALGGANIGAHLVFDVRREAHDVRQRGELSGLDADRGCKPAELGLSIGLSRGDLGRGARILQSEHGVELGALGGGTACGRRREQGDERRHVAIEVPGTIPREPGHGGNRHQHDQHAGDGPSSSCHGSRAQ